MFSRTTENILPVNPMASADENREYQEGRYGYY